MNTCTQSISGLTYIWIHICTYVHMYKYIYINICIYRLQYTYPIVYINVYTLPCNTVYLFNICIHTYIYNLITFLRESLSHSVSLWQNLSCCLVLDLFLLSFLGGDPEYPSWSNQREVSPCRDWTLSRPYLDTSLEVFFIHVPFQ